MEPLIAGLAIPLLLEPASFFVAILTACLMLLAFSIFSTANSFILFKSIPYGFEGRYHNAGIVAVVQYIPKEHTLQEETAWLKQVNKMVKKYEKFSL